MITDSQWSLCRWALTPQFQINFHVDFYFNIQAQFSAVLINFPDGNKIWRSSGFCTRCPPVVESTCKEHLIFITAASSGHQRTCSCWVVQTYKTCVPSDGSSLRARRPCLELLCTNILSETARTCPSTFTVVDTTTTCKHTDNFIHDLQKNRLLCS